MIINSHELMITDNELGKTVKLIYRGNENIVIQEDDYNPDDGSVNEVKILIPRHTLEKFMEMINV